MPLPNGISEKARLGTRLCSSPRLIVDKPLVCQRICPTACLRTVSPTAAQCSGASHRPRLRRRGVPALRTPFGRVLAPPAASRPLPAHCVCSRLQPLRGLQRPATGTGMHFYVSHRPSIQHGRSTALASSLAALPASLGLLRPVSRTARGLRAPHQFPLKSYGFPGAETAKKRFLLWKMGFSAAAYCESMHPSIQHGRPTALAGSLAALPASLGLLRAVSPTGRALRAPPPYTPPGTIKARKGFGSTICNSRLAALPLATLLCSLDFRFACFRHWRRRSSVPLALSLGFLTV